MGIVDREVLVESTRTEDPGMNQSVDELYLEFRNLSAEYFPDV